MKKVVSLMLVLVLVLGMSTVAFAAKSDVKLDPRANPQAAITGTNSGDVESGRGLGGSWSSDFVEFPLGAISGGTQLGAAASSGNTYFTKEDISSAKVTLKTIITKGAKAFDGTASWEYTDSKAYVKIKFNEWFTNNNPDGIEYEAKIYLVVDGRQWADSGITISGDYGNITNTYYEATDGSVYMGDGTIIHADGYMKNVEMDLSQGVYAYGKMFKDRNYYGVADMDVYDADEDFFDKYELDAVYHINEAGLKAVVEYVTLENEDSSSYVYYVDADGNLVDSGLKGNDKLELRGTYYLSTKYIELESNDEAPIDEEGDGYEVPGETGGDDYYPENVNDNPGTGR